MLSEAEKERRLKLQKEALKKIKKISHGKTEIGYLKQNFPRVSGNTLNALVRKGVLRTEEKKIDEDVLVYYFLTGKELE